jgi:hypothetical protein
MSVDLPHRIVSALVIFVVVLAAHRTAVYRNAACGRRVASVAVAPLVVLFVFNRIWPYGEPPVFLSG